MADTTARVLVFDSGVGAIGVGHEIHRLLPTVDLFYAMDCAGFPYGDWEETALCTHICDQLDALCRDFAPDIVVLACNSASTAVLPALRARITPEVVGVVPAIKPAAAISASGVIGLLATPGTVKREYTDHLIADFASHCTVIRVGSSVLAPAVERLFWEGEENPLVWQHAMDPFYEHPEGARMDTMVLACTHFPLVRERLAQAHPDLNWVDSGLAIARRVQHLLEKERRREGQRAGKQQALILGPREPTAALREQLLPFGIRDIVNLLPQPLSPASLT